MSTPSEMSYNFSSQKKFSTWRKLWIYLAKAEKVLGLDIGEEQIAEMAANVENIDFAKAAAEEKLTRHDVMAHVHVFAEQCPKAAPIIHLGATSCYVGDNTDLIVLRDGMNIILPKIAQCIKNFQKSMVEDFTTIEYQSQVANSKVVEWISSLLWDLNNIERVKSSLRFRGVKGTTGTQGSFLSLFDGDYSKVVQLDKLVTEMAGFERSLLICGQTYSRRTDAVIFSSLSSLCDSVYKISDDISQFSKGSILNLCMQCCTLAKLPSKDLSVIMNTFSVQWLERTLDDSACRRVCCAETFLHIDGMLEAFLALTNSSYIIKKNLDHYYGRQILTTPSPAGEAMINVSKTVHKEQVS